MNSLFGIHPKVADTISKHASSDDRVLITGATGWLGRTAVQMFAEFGVQILCVASRAREFKIGNNIYMASAWDLNQITDFSPTYVIDAAYVTREFAAESNLEDYIDTNRLLIDRISELAEFKSIRRLLTFSSGAAKQFANRDDSKELEDDPYGYLKSEAENTISELFSNSGVEFSIPRVWSIAGCHVSKISGFAFSDLICQAQKGEMRINSLGQVYRRYCLAEEVILVSMFSDFAKNRVFDTGGELIEIRELAGIIKDQSKGLSRVIAAEADGEPNNYYSDNSDWQKACLSLGYEPASIREQIIHVQDWFRENNTCT